MSFQIVVRFIAITVVLLFLVWVDAQPMTVVHDQPEVVETIRTFFNALGANNESQFDAVVTSDFYSFEGGIRFSGREILSFIKAQRSAGKSYR
jgi:hypothetical protein